MLRITGETKKENITENKPMKTHPRSAATPAAMMLLVIGCLTSQLHASESQGRICFDDCTCCHTETEVKDQTRCLTQSQYSDTDPTSPSPHPITPGAWQAATPAPMFQSLVRLNQERAPRRKTGFDPGSAAVLVGLVVKASASRAKDPRFECRLRRDFSGVESYQ